VIIIRRSKLYYTASGIVTPVGGRPVHRNAHALHTSVSNLGKLSYWNFGMVFMGVMGVICRVISPAETSLIKLFISQGDDFCWSFF